jgi:beta-lactamase regulating signal transducer with metallopeptidase domain
MNDVASLLLWSLGRTTLWLAVAALVTTLLLRIARPSWPSAHRLAWLVVLLVGWSFIRLPLTVPWYEAQLPERAATVELAPSELVVDGELPVVDIVTTAAQPSDETVATAPAAITRRPVAQLPATTNRIDWPLVLLGAWALGGAALVAAWGVGYVLFVRSLAARVPVGEVHQAEWHELLAAAGMRREIPLCTTKAFGPLLCRLPRGFEIIVPESLWRELNARERTAILRHELAHYQRGDVWTSLVARVLALAHWFNPAAWWAARQFDEAAELACDRAAAGDDATTDYANALVRLGQVGPQATFYGTGARGRSLAARIRRVLAGPSTEDSLMKKASLVAIVLGLAAASVVQIDLVAQQPAGEEKTAVEKTEPVEPTPPPTKQAPPEGDPKTTASQAAVQKMVDEARAAFEANQAAYEAETIMMEGVYDWSLRWMRAAQIAAANDEQNTAAIQAHLKRMQDLQKKITWLFNVGTRGGEEKEMRAANFYVAEAERWLAEAEVPATHRGGGTSGNAKAAEETRVVDLKITISEIEKEITKAEIDVSLAKEMFGIANSAEKRNPGAISTSEFRRLAADYEKSKLQLEYLQKRLALHRDKLKLISSEPGNQPAQPDWAFRKPTKSDPIDRGPRIAEKSVRYEGKDFESWAEELRNELSPERRAEAIQALAAFGRHGYGPQAAKQIMQAARDHSMQIEDADVQAAYQTFPKMPAGDVGPVILQSLESNDANERWFAVVVLPIFAQREETVPLFIKRLKDPSPKVRQAAAEMMVSTEPPAPELVGTLREWLASDDLAQCSIAARACYTQDERTGGTSLRVRRPLLNELLPDVLKAIERPEPFGPLVEQPLARLSQQGAVDFLDALHDSGLQPGPRLQSLVDKFNKQIQ